MLWRGLIPCAAVAALSLAAPAAAADGAWVAPPFDELRPADPDYRVVVKPQGRSRGTIFAIHGGSWVGSPDLVDAARPQVAYLARLGWRVEIVGYRSGQAAFADLVRWHARIRSRLDRGKALCAWGASAGAHLSLLLAERLGFECVIAEAGPTLLVEIPEAWDLPDVVHELALRTFGPLGLVPNSPLLANSGSRTPTLLAHATNDRTVPVGQSRAYRDTIANASLIELDPGQAPFTHSIGVEPRDRRRYRDAAAALLEDAQKRRAAHPPAGPRARVAVGSVRLRGRRVPVAVSCASGQPCRGRLTLKRSGKAIAERSFWLAAGRTGKVKPALDRKHRRAIGSGRPIKVSAVTKVRAGSGSASARRALVIRPR